MKYDDGKSYEMEHGSMTTNYQWLGNIAKLVLLIMMGVSMSANAGLFGFGSTPLLSDSRNDAIFVGSEDNMNSMRCTVLFGRAANDAECGQCGCEKRTA